MIKCEKSIKLGNSCSDIEIISELFILSYLEISTTNQNKNKKLWTKSIHEKFYKCKYLQEDVGRG